MGREISIEVTVDCPSVEEIFVLEDALGKSFAERGSSSTLSEMVVSEPIVKRGVRVVLGFKAQTSSPVRAEEDVDEVLRGAGFCFFEDYEKWGGFETGPRELWG